MSQELHRPELVASDVDGTLLWRFGPMSAATVSTIHRCLELDIEFLLVTGRPLRWIAPLAEQVPDLGNVICANGAAVFNIARNHVETCYSFSAEQLAELCGRIRTSLPAALFAFETLSGLYTEPGFPTRAPADATIIGSAAELGAQQAMKLLVTIGGQDSDGLLTAVLPHAAGLAEASHSNPRNGLVELAPIGVTKASTLSRYCADRGIEAHNVAAFGDMPNDLEMLGWAGMSVAMGNSHPDVLAAAAHITTSVHDDGVSRFLDPRLHS